VTKITGSLLEDRYTFLIISRSVLFRMRKVWDRSCRETQNAHFLFNFFFLRKSCRLWDMWKHLVERGRPHFTKWRMRFACWIPKATNSHPEYVTIVAFPLQRLLHDSASVLCYTYIALLLSVHVFPTRLQSINSWGCVTCKEMWRGDYKWTVGVWDESKFIFKDIYLLTYLLTYLLHGAESFLRS